MTNRLARWTLVAALFAGAVTAGGCGKSSSPTRPASPLDQDGADDLAIQTTGAGGVTSLDMTFGRLSMLGSPQLRPGAGPSAATYDTTFTLLGVTISASAHFYDSQNRLLDHYGPTAVRLEWESRIVGDREWPRDTASIGHHGTLSFQGIGLLDTTITLNGTALDTLSNHFRSYDGTRTRLFYWNSSLATSNVVVRRAASWPLSGTLTFTVHADRLRSNNRTDVEAHLEGTVVVTFNGTSEPTVVVNGTWHYRWNMFTNEIVRA